MPATTAEHKLTPAYTSRTIAYASLNQQNTS
jgi:hypothetical protein